MVNATLSHLLFCCSDRSLAESVPDHVEELYTEMMEECARPSQMFGRLSATDAGWLRIYTLEQITLSRERLGDDIERELRVRFFQASHVPVMFIHFAARLP